MSNAKLNEMKDLKTRIYEAINKERNNGPDYKYEGYEDDYDGFTHQTYGGLVCDVIDALFEDGLENPTNSEIEEYIFQMI
jgi:hypothetical protein